MTPVERVTGISTEGRSCGKDEDVKGKLLYNPEEGAIWKDEIRAQVLTWEVASLIT